ncbi:MAG: Sec-independent protein translocase subunit TatA/TatB [Planctomycetota bacterium]|jgi:sec-independent protein translocase protein TatA
MLAVFGLPGGAEWLIILLVALLLFGSRLPSVMRSIGRSVNEFKRGLREVEDEVESAAGEDDASADGSSTPAG